MVRNHKLRTIFLGQPPKKRCLYFVTYSLFCIFVPKIYIFTKASYYYEQTLCAENIYIY